MNDVNEGKKSDNMLQCGNVMASITHIKTWGGINNGDGTGGELIYFSFSFYTYRHTM